ncbi:DUF3365 domain-containing protein [Psychrobium sp. MM17-31]|uniref:Tll0287-like domain-containing protein n=1 Tax=Psychrobium sp. MM17-31 TaxID=2917758 RepID=UPI001EF6F7FE|nr:DUF3365 domain-containing protein [Psychrobium sp. MM17-31]MCG7530198.1 DUF3365 domain-containing protein [Psychrobium sp. MM17-31]
MAIVSRQLMALFSTSSLAVMGVNAQDMASVEQVAQGYNTQIAQARTLTKSYASALQNTLKPALKSSGPAGALKACNVSVPSITKAVNNQSKWQVSRTSLKPRSQANMPSDWEKSVLLHFESQKQQGVNPKALEASAIIERGNKRYLRYMKAIPTAQKPCLTCHGTNIKPQLLQQIRLLYPQDKAIGFNAGDLRGAFSLTLPFLE